MCVPGGPFCAPFPTPAMEAGPSPAQAVQQKVLSEGTWNVWWGNVQSSEQRWDQEPEGSRGPLLTETSSITTSSLLSPVPQRAGLGCMGSWSILQPNPLTTIPIHFLQKARASQPKFHRQMTG